MNKKGASLVELIAVIVIMGVIAGITTLTVTNVIARQRKNSVITGLNNIYESTKALLVQVETSSYDENITLIDNDFCYISLTTLIDSGNVDGENYKPVGNEIYFCYIMNGLSESFVVISNSTPNKIKPESTGSATVDGVLITFDSIKNKFKIA